MVNAITKAIFDKLKGTAALMTQLGGNAGNYYKCYNTIAYQAAALPYITFGILTAVPVATFASLNAIEDCTVWLNLFSSTGQKDIADIFDDVDAALQNATLTISGYTAMVCRREYVGNIMFDPDTRIYQLSLRYRVQAAS